ncbi:MAG: ParA family protein [Pseudomonadota bacterium]
MKTIMIINGKGGSGKSTLSMSLAGHFAAQGYVTMLKDYDPQGACIEWLNNRPVNRAKIFGIAAYKNVSGVTRAWHMRAPTDAEYCIVDTPAALQLSRYAEDLRTASNIIVPIVPSPIDIRSSAFFIRDLLTHIKAYPTRARIGIVASRVQTSGRAFYALQRIFSNLSLPFIASLSEHENYIAAAEHGVSMLELDGDSARREREEWRPLLNWLDDKDTNQRATPNANVARGR